TFVQAVHTDVIARYGVFVDAPFAAYQATLNAKTGAAGQSLIGNLKFGAGGFLMLFDEVPGTAGVFGITGDLTLAEGTDVFLNWNAKSPDLLEVTGTASLAGTLDVTGIGPQNAGTNFEIVSAASVVNSFSAYVWTDWRPITISGSRQNKDT